MTKREVGEWISMPILYFTFTHPLPIPQRALITWFLAMILKWFGFERKKKSKRYKKNAGAIDHKCASRFQGYVAQ